MKATKLIAAAMCAAMALAIAGRAGAGPSKDTARATSARAASHGAHQAATWSRAGLRNRRLSSSYQSFPYYPYYGNAIIENSDEADWGEQWSSLYEDNDGPYARSTWENPPGQARMWEFPEK